MANPQDECRWTVTSEKVEAAISRIIEVSQPLKLILFGSWVRNQQSRDSDLDVLIVVNDATPDPRKESVRIRRALRGISMAMDILVVPESTWEELRDIPGLILREAYTKGRVVYESR